MKKAQTITLQDPQKQSELNALIEKANCLKKDFLRIQNEAETLKDNIDKNQKIKQELKEENERLLAITKKGVVNDYGKVNFSKFDDLVSKVEINKNKIKVLDNVIEKFKYKLELFLITDYRESENAVILAFREVYSYLSKNYLDEIFSEEFKNKVNVYFSILKLADPMVYYNKNDYFSIFNEKLESISETDLSIEVEGLLYPEINFYSGDEVGLKLTKRISELKELIGILDE